MRTCFVNLCDVKNKNQPNRTMFSVPKEKTLFAKWVEVLPKVQTLRLSDRVCYLHFLPEDIIYTFDHYINGEVYKIKRDRPRLKPYALPCLEMTTKEDLQSYSVRPLITSKPKVVKIHEDSLLSDQICDVLIMEDHQQINKENITYDENQDQAKQEDNSTVIIGLENDTTDFVDCRLTQNYDSGGQIENLLAAESTSEYNKLSFAISETNNERINVFNLIYDNAYEVLTPNTLWGTHRCTNRSFLCFSYMNTLNMQITKVICIKSDGSVDLLLDGRSIKNWQLLEDIYDLDTLSMILDRVDKWSICSGKLTNSNCNILVETNDDNCWVTKNNEQVFLCKSCLQRK